MTASDIDRIADAVAQRVGRLGYSVSEAAQVTGIGRDLLYRLIKAGELPAVQIGRRLVLSRESLEQLLRRERLA